MPTGFADVNSRAEPLVLVFDGHCGVCSRFVAWAKARDRSGRIRFVHCQEASVRALGVTRAECESEAIAIGPGSTIHRGAAAINAVLRELPEPWPSVVRVSSHRGLAAIEAAGYRWFARNRHLFSRWGLEPECAKPGAHSIDAHGLMWGPIFRA